MANTIVRIFLLLLSTKYVQWTWSDDSDFAICHHDTSLNPQDGILPDYSFPWLGFTQYIHVTTGLPHQTFAPRVVLIQSQFVIGTAADMLKVPKNYKMGNIIFGDYEREEHECGLAQNELRQGFTCPRAFLEVPLVDIVPHPEHSRFGVGNSLALIKLLVPLKSRYMVPICLPTLIERVKMKRDRDVYLIDYISTVPNDFDAENLGKRTLQLYTHETCMSYQRKPKKDRETVTHLLCTTGCGVRPGAPIIHRSTSGHFELMGLAVGGAGCSNRQMRTSINQEPPVYIDVYPYLDWIVNVIKAHTVPKIYPQNFRRSEGGVRVGVKKPVGRREHRCDWSGRTYSCGNLCFRSKRRQRKAAFIYLEKFEVRADPIARVNVYIKISAGIECTIVCARLRLPSRLANPSIVGIGSYNITIKFETDWFPLYFYFSVGLYGRNSTNDDFIKWMSDREKGHWKTMADLK